MRLAPSVRYEIITEGGHLAPAVEREARNILKAYMVTEGTGVYTYEDGTTVGEDTLILTLIAPQNPGEAWFTANIAAPQNRDWAQYSGAQQLHEHVIALARNIRDANSQECVLVVRTDSSGVHSAMV